MIKDGCYESAWPVWFVKNVGPIVGAAGKVERGDVPYLAPFHFVDDGI